MGLSVEWEKLGERRVGIRILEIQLRFESREQDL